MFLYGTAALNEKTDNMTIKAPDPFFSLTDVLVETFTKEKILCCTKRPTGFGLCDVQMLVPAADHATVPHGPAKSCCFKYLFFVHCVHFCQDI